MAKIWAVYEGKNPTRDGPWAHLPLRDSIELFDLQPQHYVSDLEAIPPRFGDVNRDLTFFGYKLIVVEIGKSEGKQAKWKPGYYRSRITPKEGFLKLVRWVFAKALGDANVVRVEIEPTNDSQGRESLKVTVVIAPRASRTLKGDAVLAALVGLQELFRDMGDDRVPIVEYATEAELLQDGRP